MRDSGVGVCSPFPKTLTLFMTKIFDFPYPTYDLIKKLTHWGIIRGRAFFTGFSLPALNGVEEGKARMGEGGHDEEVTSSKKEIELKTRVQKSISYL